MQDAARFFPFRATAIPISKARLVSDLLKIAGERDLRVLRAALARFTRDDTDAFKPSLYALLLPLIFVPPKDESPPDKPYGWLEVKGGRLSLPDGFRNDGGTGQDVPVLTQFDRWRKTQPRQDLARFRSQIVK